MENTLENIKIQMKEFKDFFGSDLLDVSEIDKVKTKSELSEIIDRHSSHIEMMCNDAICSLERFRKSVGLSIIDLDTHGDDLDLRHD